MQPTGLTRRRMLLAVGALPFALGAGQLLTNCLADTTDGKPPVSAAEALERLKAGNKRFVEEKPAHGRISQKDRKELAGGQQPFATILSCSDSRVPPEIVFDQGLGDLFVARVAGNVVAPDVLGSLQYAELHLKVPLLVVLGHEGCGAVAAALQAKTKGGNEPEHIKALIGMIEPGLKDLDGKLTGPALLSAAVEANVRWSMAQIADDPGAKKALKEKRFELVGAVYQLETGAVRFLS